MAYTPDLTIVNQLVEDITVKLSRVGLIFRIFGRVKTPRSIGTKLDKKREEYIGTNKKMQDLFGIRIGLYFNDDVFVAQEIVAGSFKVNSKSVDEQKDQVFGPTRCNIIYELPEELAAQSALIKAYDLIDTTFEVQYRTILSEGWHEVEHDLRYKCKEDWNHQEDLSRSLNGIMATLETCDWSMIKMFDELAWRHYKGKDWEAMIRHKYRLRFQSSDLCAGVLDLFNGDTSIAKKVFRVERGALLQTLSKQTLSLPMTSSNLVFLINRLFLMDHRIKALEPEALTEILEERLKTYTAAGESSPRVAGGCPSN